MSRGGRGNFQRGGRNNFQQSTGELVAFGKYLHNAESTLIFKCDSKDKYPAFNCPVFNNSKKEIGKVGEVFGRLDDYFFSVIPAEGVKADSFKVDDNIMISSDKLFDVERLKNPPAPKRGGARGGQRGGRGAPRGGNGFGNNKGPRPHY